MKDNTDYVEDIVKLVDMIVDEETEFEFFLSIILNEANNFKTTRKEFYTELYSRNISDEMKTRIYEIRHLLNSRSSMYALSIIIERNMYDFEKTIYGDFNFVYFRPMSECKKILTPDDFGLYLYNFKFDKNKNIQLLDTQEIFDTYMDNFGNNSFAEAYLYNADVRDYKYVTEQNMCEYCSDLAYNYHRVRFIKFVMYDKPDWDEFKLLFANYSNELI